MKNKKAELLAPAGDWNSLVAAVNAGADAVYLAGHAYGARAYAKNFSNEELLESIDYLHLFDKKIYLTINTLNKNAELETLSEFLAPFYNRGLDGVIVQDLGVIKLLKSLFPGLSLHASTQMTVTGARGAALLKDYGCERVVPARELSLEELIAIKKTGIEVEAFIHGAMCYCYSGQCLMSSMLGGRSGNRGRCAGPCRLPFTSFDGEKLPENKAYVLSLKDLCTIENIGSILDAGIDSLKIEGRMKSPEYVAYVTSLYRKYIDKYYAGHDTTVDKKDLDTLKSLFVRGDISNGYLFRKNSRDMVTLSKPGYNGSDDRLMQQLHEKYVVDPKCYPVNLNAYISIGENLRVMVSDGTFCGEAVGNIIEPSVNRPADEDSVAKKLIKLGGTFLKANETDIYINGDCFVNVKEINECRRKAVAEFINNKLNCYRRQWDGVKVHDSSMIACKNNENNPTSQPVLSVLVRTIHQLDYLKTSDSSIRICVESDLIADILSVGGQAVRDLHDIAKKHDFYIALPRIIRLADTKFLEIIYSFLTEINCVNGIIIRNLESLGWVLYIKSKEELTKIKILADYNFYSFNNEAIDFYREYGLDITLPLELNKEEYKTLNTAGTEMVVYGRTPLMVSAGCVKNTLDRCDKVSGFKYLSDRTNTEFVLYKDCRRCENIIYNSVPTSLHQFTNSIANYKLSCIRLEFVDETPARMGEVMSTFADAFNLDLNGSNKSKEVEYKFTKGYFKRGVE